MIEHKVSTVLYYIADMHIVHKVGNTTYKKKTQYVTNIRDTK